MRNPDRIDAMLEQLRAYWHANPDLRLGQIVMNAYRIEWQERQRSPEYRRWLASDTEQEGGRFFNMEDDRLARGIELLAAM